MIKKTIIIYLITVLILGKCFAEEFNGLFVYCLDVGQGDATVFTCNGYVMMIDGGDSSSSSFIYSYLRKTLGLSHIDAIIATHPHSDHVGGLAAALNACSVDVIYTPILEYNTRQWNSVLKYAELQGTPIVIPSYGEYFYLGDALVEILGPLRYNINLNNMSIIIKITFGEYSFLWMGDAEWEEEMDLLDSGFDLSADVIKIGHHGSNSSSLRDFLEAVSPSYAIISVGSENPYGQPGARTLETIEDLGIKTFRTDCDGTIVCMTDGDNIAFINLDE